MSIVVGTKEYPYIQDAASCGMLRGMEMRVKRFGRQQKQGSSARRGVLRHWLMMRRAHGDFLKQES